jgi:hypothetical protein
MNINDIQAQNMPSTLTSAMSIKIELRGDKKKKYFKKSLLICNFTEE